MVAPVVNKSSTRRIFLSSISVEFFILKASRIFVQRSFSEKWVWVSVW